MAKIATTNAADWQAVIERLEAEQAELLAQAATVRAGEGAHALAAATGDATAKKALASADAEAARLATDAENLSLALQEARQRLISAEAGERPPGRQSSTGSASSGGWPLLARGWPRRSRQRSAASSRP